MIYHFKIGQGKRTTLGQRRLSSSGRTRPVGSDIYVGFQFFDTSVEINKSIYASAISGSTVTWVDATGATV